MKNKLKEIIDNAFMLGFSDGEYTGILIGWAWRIIIILFISGLVYLKIFIL